METEEKTFMPGTTARHLSPEQLEEFDTEGYLVVEDVFDEARLDAVAEEVTAVIDCEARQLVADGVLSSTYEGYPFTSRLTHITAETTAVYNKILSGQLSLPSIFELIRTPAMLDIAESLCGPELIASSVYRIRPKMPNVAHGVVPWHQDSGYFEPFCDNSLVLTCWLPLVDATAENGCLQVIPRVHQGPVVTHTQGEGYLVIPDEHLPSREFVTVPVKRGDALLLTNRTPHQSTPNYTDVIRWSMDLRYQSAALPTNAPVTRLPGEIVSGVAPAPLACYPPEADFLIRSQLRPDEVVQTAEAFDRLRRTYQPSTMTDRWNLWNSSN
jgi:ectoine hydroxylase-related dioxygenase (phytanoyl-CoA dioxygenase family)